MFEKLRTALFILLLSGVHCFGADQAVDMSAPKISLFVQVSSPKPNEPIYFVVEVSNPSAKALEVSQMVNIVRQFAGTKENAMSRAVGGSRTQFEDGDIYQVCIVVTSPPPTGSFLPHPIDARLQYGAPVRSVTLGPKESILQKIELPADMKLSGECHVSATLVQRHKEVVGSDESRFSIPGNVGN